mmetsp:Transcript_26673/g.49861  ORF Transcript_26673/g.49861 Transcript_26673/m.49861 type:complete len:208 (+) Transcript_26673:601-1224(+)
MSLLRVCWFFSNQRIIIRTCCRCCVRRRFPRFILFRGPFVPHRVKGQSLHRWHNSQSDRRQPILLFCRRESRYCLGLFIHFLVFLVQKVNGQRSMTVKVPTLHQNRFQFGQLPPCPPFPFEFPGLFVSNRAPDCQRLVAMLPRPFHLQGHFLCRKSVHNCHKLPWPTRPFRSSRTTNNLSIVLPETSMGVSGKANVIFIWMFGIAGS